MSRSQWIVVGVLGVAVALVLGLIGAYLLRYLTQARVVQVIDGDTIEVEIDAQVHTVRYL